MKRKIRKLLRDPRQFFVDLYLKRFRGVARLAPKRKVGFERYTVVSAVYNVAPYLEQFIKSLVDQRLDFTTNISLVLVDDGSTDASSEIIERWRKRFPDNIKCIQKQNGGQASARNVGLEHVVTEWVTFIDPDDFVDVNYFFDVDIFLKRNHAKNVTMVSCNFIFYYEDRNVFSDTHPLRYRFSKGDNVLKYDDLEKSVQLSVNSAFFRSAVLRFNGILFDERIRPNFEDAHFVGIYLSLLDAGVVGFAAKPRYYYRKRSDGSSTLDTAWAKPGLYDEVLRYGCLDLLKRSATRFNHVPKHIQRTVLYHLIWYVKRILDRPESVESLCDQRRTVFLGLVVEIFSYIDAQTVLEFELAGCWFLHKVGMLAAFKDEDPRMQIAYVENYDPVKSQVLVRYYARNIGVDAFWVGAMDVVPDYSKTVCHDFCGSPFVYERRVWLSLPGPPCSEALRVEVGDIPAFLTLGNRQFRNGLELSDLRQFYCSDPVSPARPSGREDSWLFMDRDSHADDNAEHLYRYVQRVHPEQKICFVLRRDSHDWDRLARDRFNLFAYGTRDHEEALRSCKRIVSSHADGYVVDYFGDGSLKNKQFVFLQHGVTHNDLSSWLNSKRIDCFVTTTPLEHRSICGDGGRYKFTQKEVVLTGFPRHDALVKIRSPAERVILVMPTWRKSLVGETLSGNTRTLRDDFMESRYARAWLGFLSSSELCDLAERFAIQVVFCPHVNMLPYFSGLSFPAGIDVVDKPSGTIQELFMRAAVLVTDYSSVAFDFAYLMKPILYYQFDENEFFAQEHTVQRGYFDYREDGFGPVVASERELMRDLRVLVERDMQPSQKYLERMNEFFPFRDGRCCERVYDSIVALDRPRLTESGSTLQLHEAARVALRGRNWRLAEGRFRRLLNPCVGDLEPAEAFEAKVQFAEALRRLGRFGEAMGVLSTLESEASSPDRAFDLRSFFACKARVCMDQHEFLQAGRFWNAYEDWPCEDTWLRWLCGAEVGEGARETDLAGSTEGGFDAVEAAALSALGSKDWRRLAALMPSADDLNSLRFGMQLLFVRAWRELGDVEHARSALASYVEASGRNRGSVLEEARIAHLDRCWDNVLTGFDEAYPEGVTSVPDSDLALRIDALKNIGRRHVAADELILVANSRPSNPQILRMQAELALEGKEWRQAAALWGRLHEITGSAHYGLARALRFGGRVEEALDLLRDPTLNPPNGLEELQLLADLAQLQGDYDLAAECWRTVLSDYAADAPDCAWERLQFLTLVRQIGGEALPHGAGRCSTLKGRAGIS